MSIYSQKVEMAEAIKTPAGVEICYKKSVGQEGSYEAIHITSAKDAIALRIAVNKAADILLENHKKRGRS